MDDQPLDLKQQRLIRNTKILIVLAIIFSIYNIIIVLIDFYVLYNHISFFSFLLNIVLISYGVFILLIILKKADRFFETSRFFYCSTYF